MVSQNIHQAYDVRPGNGLSSATPTLDSIAFAEFRSISLLGGLLPWLSAPWPSSSGSRRTPASYCAAQVYQPSSLAASVAAVSQSNALKRPHVEWIALGIDQRAVGGQAARVHRPCWRRHQFAGRQNRAVWRRKERRTSRRPARNLADDVDRV